MYAKKIDFVEGGTSRQKSIKNAMEYLNQNTKEIDYVLIHDGARPFINEQIIENLLENIEECGAVAPGITPTDTIKEIDDKNLISKHLKRTNLIAIQTPQFFDFKKLLEAHEKASLKDYEYTDDTEIWGDFCGQVKIVNGDFKNIKITYPGDLERGANFD